MTFEDTEFYIQALNSDECSNCNNNKQIGKAFCYNCFKKLPDELQRILYRRIGFGFESAFELASKWLVDA